MKVAIVHDYLTQRGGAERVVLSASKAFPGAAVYTSIYSPGTTFPEFGELEIHTLPISRLPFLRRYHRLALPLLARSFSQLHVSAEVALCSSSGWAHGAGCSGRKVVYCHSPARWLYQTSVYLGDRPRLVREAFMRVQPRLLEWDRKAASTADVYLTNSHAVKDRIKDAYGFEAEIVPPPPTLDPRGQATPIAGLTSDYFLCVSRLLPYKNVDAVVAAFTNELSHERLVVVGSGPQERALRGAAGRNVTFVGVASDTELRWLYRECAAIVAASYEDYGLTPLEAATFGRPALVLRFGGFLDTVREGSTGLFFDRPEAGDIAEAVRRARSHRWHSGKIVTHAETYAEERFIERLRTLVLGANEGPLVTGRTKMSAQA